MILIDGKKIAAELREELKKEVLILKEKHSKIPVNPGTLLNLDFNSETSFFNFSLNSAASFFPSIKIIN